MLISDKQYNILKVVAQDVLPAVATALLIIVKAWHLVYGTEIAAPIMAVDLALGLMLHLSTKSYRQVLKEVNYFFREYDEDDDSDSAPIRGNEALTFNAPADEKEDDEKTESENSESGEEKEMTNNEL